MNKEAVIQAIDAAIDAGIKSVEERRDPSTGHTFGAHVRSLTTVTSPSSAVLIKVRDVLLCQPELHPLIGDRDGDVDIETARYHTLTGGWANILPIKLTGWLLAKSLEFPGGSREALGRLLDFLDQNAVTGHRVVPVLGLWVKNPIKVTDNIWVSPIWDLPASVGRDELLEIATALRYHLPQRSDSLGPAIAAVVQRFKMSPAVTCHGEPPPPWIIASDEAFADLEGVAYASSLIPGTMAQCLGRWIETEKVDSIPGLTSGTGGASQMAEILPTRHTDVPATDGRALGAILRGYWRMPEADKDKLKRSLRRLAISRARRSIADRYIELAIALEVLLGDDQKGEISHKIATRGALAASRNTDNRKQLFKFIKEAYNQRSAIVHTGRPSNRNNVAQLGGHENIIETVSDISVMISKKIINKGNFPVWSDLEIHADKI